ncbi:hypothetical protein LXL04_031043 [Taraxacum kok-saghyz]
MALLAVGIATQDDARMRTRKTGAVCGRRERCWSCQVGRVVHNGYPYRFEAQLSSIPAFRCCPILYSTTKQHHHRRSVRPPVPLPSSPPPNTDEQSTVVLQLPPMASTVNHHLL